MGMTRTQYALQTCCVSSTAKDGQVKRNGAQKRKVEMSIREPSDDLEIWGILVLGWEFHGYLISRAEYNINRLPISRQTLDSHTAVT